MVLKKIINGREKIPETYFIWEKKQLFSGLEITSITNEV